MKKLLILTAVLSLALTISCQKENDKGPSKSVNKYQGNIRDIDGNFYKTVKIGKQWWMAENLKTSRFNDSTPIPRIDTRDDWKANTDPAYCWYRFDSAQYSAIYGALYNWFTVETALLCPKGWRVPTDDDWLILEEHIGVDESEINTETWRGCNVGGMLKIVGTVYWTPPNAGATNETGFTALPAGYISRLGSHSWIETNANFWTSSESEKSSSRAFYRTLNTWDGCVFRAMTQKEYGYSVRCVKE